MAKRAVALRLDPVVLEWVDGYARERGVSRQAVLEGAVVSFRADCAGGVPDLEPVSGERAAGPAAGAARGRSPRPAPTRGPVRERPLVSTAAELMLERQRRLNRGRAGS